MAQQLTASVPKDRLVEVSEQDTQAFFSVLTSTDNGRGLWRAAKKRFQPLTKFQDMLQTYLSIVADKVDALLPDLPDEDYMAFVDWVLLQGHDTVQELLNTPDAEALRECTRWWSTPGKLYSARGHWHM